MAQEVEFLPTKTRPCVQSSVPPKKEKNIMLSLFGKRG
jgi:hypothetical protein